MSITILIILKSHMLPSLFSQDFSPLIHINLSNYHCLCQLFLLNRGFNKKKINMDILPILYYMEGGRNDI